MFKNLNLKTVYDSSESDLIKDLFCPLLKESVSYKRGVGYFTSGWLKLATEGLINLAINGGCAKMITSPYLEKKDWEAFKRGNEAKKDELVYLTLKKEVENLSKTMQEDTLTALAWLIADGLLEIKFAIPQNKIGDFHDKFAIFEDMEDNQVAIHGSYNDSIHGTLNGESFSIFRSWIDGQKEYVEKHKERFEKIYNGKNEFFKMYDLPEAIKNSIIKFKENGSRPYSLTENTSKSNVKVPEEINLYDYQETAIDNWFKNGKGIFEMATGTGKTITSLALAVKLHQELKEELAIVISVPFNHLVDQWKEDVLKFGFIPVICRGSYTNWYNKLKSRVQDFNLRARKSLVVITTHSTSSGNKFTSLVDRVEGNILFIGDEVHYLGAQNLRRALRSKYNFRVGLSATPKRWFDEEGSTYLNNYFVERAIEYPLEKAISKGFLTPYRFIPQPVELTECEMQEYSRLTILISKRMAIKKNRKEDEDERLETLLRQRANIINSAENKLIILENNLKLQIKEEGLRELRHTILYCPPGETNTYLQIVSRLGLRGREFIHTIPIKQRMKILKQFENGDIQVIVAIKCLDEGVNIPATRRAYFIASTTNPREFVQRRGRILRTCEGKTEAILVDYIVVPPSGILSINHEHEKSLLRKELPRFAEFAYSSQNEFTARDIIYPIVKKYDLLHLFDKKPWDLYFDNLNIEGRFV